MKKITTFLSVLVLSATWASAQQMVSNSERVGPTTSSSDTARDVTGFAAPATPGPGVTTQSIRSFPNPHPNLKPRLSGIFVDGAKYGTVMISPGAPAEYGMGERYLSAPSQTGYDLQHESGTASTRTSGGFKLFSLEF